MLSKAIHISLTGYNFFNFLFYRAYGFPLRQLQISIVEKADEECTEPDCARKNANSLGSSEHEETTKLVTIIIFSFLGVILTLTVCIVLCKILQYRRQIMHSEINQQIEQAKGI